MNILTLVVNWYILLYLKSLTEGYDTVNHLEFRHSHERFRRDISELTTLYTQKLYEIIHDYLIIASVRECMDGNWGKWNRHSNSHFIAPYIHTSDIILYNEEELISGMKKAFQDYKWTRLYGGIKWYNAVKSFDIKNPVLFIDHVIDLQHNTGSILNKSFGALNGMDAIECSIFKFFLDVKKEDNLVTILGYFDDVMFDSIWKFVKRFKTLYWHIYCQDKKEFMFEPDKYKRWLKVYSWDFNSLKMAYKYNIEEDKEEDRFFAYKPLNFESKKEFYVEKAPELPDDLKPITDRNRRDYLPF